MTLALAPAASREAARARPFASVERHATLAAAGEAWRELEPAGGAYQGQAFVEAYVDAFGLTPAIVVARDGEGRPVALLPLGRRRIGPLRVAASLGGGWANYHMGLFRPGLVWSADDVRALLRAAARVAEVDLLAFPSAPARWDGHDNPLCSLPRVAAPSPAFASALPRAHPEWLDAHFSRASQKKLRKKIRKLDAFGAPTHRRAAGEAEAARFLEAFHAHKAAQARARGAPDAHEGAEVGDLLRRLAATGAMEMHALLAGERVVATFGGVCAGGRLSGLIVSYDGAPEIAAASPGEWLLIEVVRDAIARGLHTFDLGVGDSRYKRELCEIEEQLFDVAFGVGPLGRLGAAAWLGGRAAMAYVKSRPQLLRGALRLRAAFARG